MADGRGMRRYTDSQRQHIIRSFAASGQSAAAFCRQHGVSTVTLAQWRKRYGQSRQEPAAAPRPDRSWLPVVITGPGDSSPAESRRYVMSVGGCRLEVPAGFAPGEVAQLWQLLAGAAPESRSNI